jgi:hypothetical protein
MGLGSAQLGSTFIVVLMHGCGRLVMLPSSCAHVFEGLLLHLLKLAPRNQSRIVVLVDVDHNIVVINRSGRVGHPDLPAHVPYPRGHYLLPLFTQLRATTDTLPPHGRRILK